MNKTNFYTGIKNTAAAFALSIAFTSLPALADDMKAEFMLESSDTVISVLQRHIGEYLYIQTHSGKEINGKLKFIGKKVIHIEKVAGRDYYDAVIKKDSIESVMVKVRGKK